MERMFILGNLNNILKFSNPLWSKFQHYEYPVIYEMIENVLYKLKSEYISKANGVQSKKIKI